MKLLRIVKLNFLHWRSDMKYAAIIVYLVLYTYDRLHGLAAFASDLGQKISPWLFPFLPSRGSIFLPLMLAYILLIADAPFRTGLQQFILLRTGKRTWMAGQLLYIFAISVGFTLLLWVLSLIWILHEVSWSGEWGQVLITAARAGGYSSYGVYLQIDYSIMKNATPLEVSLWCSGAMVAVCYFLGVVMAACNLWGKKGVGTVLVSTMVTIGVIPSFFSSDPGPVKLLNWISPLTWMDRKLMGFPGQNLPSYAYGIIAPALLGLGCSALLLLTIGKCCVETEKE